MLVLVVRFTACNIVFGLQQIHIERGEAGGDPSKPEDVRRPDAICCETNPHACSWAQSTPRRPGDFNGKPYNSNPALAHPIVMCYIALHLKPKSLCLEMLAPTACSVTDSREASADLESINVHRRVCLSPYGILRSTYLGSRVDMTKSCGVYVTQVFRLHF